MSAGRPSEPRANARSGARPDAPAGPAEVRPGARGPGNGSDAATPEAPEDAGGEGSPVPASGAVYPLLERALDVALAGVQALVCLPAWILVPLAVKLEDGGPVLHAQERVGRDGRLFRSWKFRTMTPRRREGRGGPDGHGEPDAPRQAELEEHRVTRVGRLLRATALDELPQIWNIFVGDMSYVGPRPLLPEERAVAEGGDVVRLDRLPGYRERHRVRPGLTGLAQVRLPRDAPHREKFRLDVRYVRRRSLSLDLRLILRSVWISLRGAWPDVGDDG